VDLRIGIIGCGRMGTALARLVDLHRMPLLLANRTSSRAAGLAADLPSARIAPPERVAAESDLTILATPIDATCHDLAPRIRHSGSVIVDVSNPWFGTPPAAAYRSAAQQIAAALPGCAIVKAFNCLSARWITACTRSPTPVTVPIAGDDHAAKRLVTRFCEVLGFDTADAGSLASSRCIESLPRLLLCMNAGAAGAGQVTTAGAWASAARTTPKASPPPT
jgi:predicted dinucleotide-binding enzyme